MTENAEAEVAQLDAKIAAVKQLLQINARNESTTKEKKSIPVPPKVFILGNRNIMD